jgi:hypothetical protein
VNNPITVEGTTYRLSRNGNRTFALLGDNGPIITAEWADQRTINAEWQSSRFTLTRPRWWRNIWEAQHDGAQTGTILRGVMKSTGDLSADLPLPVRTLLLYAVGFGWNTYPDTNHNG